MKIVLVLMIYITLMLKITPAAAQNFAEQSSSKSCQFLQPSSYVPNYIRTVEHNGQVNLYPRPDKNCSLRGTIAMNSSVKVHAELGDWRFVENLSGSGWGWITKDAFDAPTSNCDFLQPSSYVPNYIRTIEYNDNVDLFPNPDKNCAPRGVIATQSSVKVHAELGDWRFIENLSGNGWGWITKDAFDTPTNNCDFLQPSSYVPNYVSTVKDNNGVELFPCPDNCCVSIGFIATGSSVKIHAESGDWRFVENQSGRGWGWINQSALDLNTDPTPKPDNPPIPHHPTNPDVPSPAVPGDYTANLAMLKATRYRNTNHDNSPNTNTPSASLPINNLLVPWRDYEATGRITSPIAGSGSFRVFCEFSHLAYDDPIVLPNQPGAAHLHMFFGNTDANAYSTADSLLNSGSSTCNGQELNRTAYWVPAFIDTNGNVPIPNDALIYYKAYYGPDSSPGLTQVYPQGMRLISGMAMATAPQPGHDGFRELFFRCYKPGTGGSNPINTKSVTIPDCGSDRYLEMNVKFQTCWNEQDPSNYRNNAAYSDVWPTSGSCPASHPYKLPQMEYRIFFHNHEGSENWILSSDVNMRDQTTINGHGYSLHGDWFGGWNREVNQRWIDNCVNIVDTDCDEGLLADPRRNPNALGLKIRPQYNGEMRIPGDAVLEELCPVDKNFSGQASVALCQPTSM